MQVKITGVSQNFNLADGATRNELVLVLPDGYVLRVGVTEDDTQRVLSNYVVRKEVSVFESAQTSPEALTRDYSPMELNDEGAFVFGGVPAALPEQPAAPMQASQRRAASIQVDESGNPILTGPGMADPLDIISGASSGEEDGVAAL